VQNKASDIWVCSKIDLTILAVHSKLPKLPGILWKRPRAYKVSFAKKPTQNIDLFKIDYVIIYGCLLRSAYDLLGEFRKRSMFH